MKLFAEFFKEATRKLSMYALAVGYALCWVSLFTPWADAACPVIILHGYKWLGGWLVIAATPLCLWRIKVTKRRLRWLSINACIPSLMVLLSHVALPIINYDYPGPFRLLSLPIVLLLGVSLLFIPIRPYTQTITVLAGASISFWLALVLARLNR